MALPAGIHSKLAQVFGVSRQAVYRSQKQGAPLPSAAFDYKVTFGGGLALELRGGAPIPHIPINIHIPGREPDWIRLQEPPQLR